MGNFAKDLLEMMAAWDKIQAATAVQFPNASDEEQHQISSAAFRKALGFVEQVIA